MSNSIKLNCGKEIRNWMQVASTPGLVSKYTEMTVVNLKDFLQEKYEDIPKTVPQDGTYYSVEHRIFTPEGDPLLAVGRVYIAHTTEEALGQYLFGYPVQITGQGTEMVYTKLWGYFYYEMQEIKVSELPDGEYYQY